MDLNFFLIKKTNKNYYVVKYCVFTDNLYSKYRCYTIEDGQFYLRNNSISFLTVATCTI